MSNIHMQWIAQIHKMEWNGDEKESKSVPISQSENAFHSHFIKKKKLTSVFTQEINCLNIPYYDFHWQTDSVFHTFVLFLSIHTPYVMLIVKKKPGQTSMRDLWSSMISSSISWMWLTASWNVSSSSGISSCCKQRTKSCVTQIVAVNVEDLHVMQVPLEW